jgi:hypothetical protein
LIHIYNNTTPTAVHALDGAGARRIRGTFVLIHELTCEVLVRVILGGNTYVVALRNVTLTDQITRKRDRRARDRGRIDRKRAGRLDDDKQGPLAYTLHRPGFCPPPVSTARDTVAFVRVRAGHAACTHDTRARVEHGRERVIDIDGQIGGTISIV